MVKPDETTLEPGPKTNPAPTATPPASKTDIRQDPQNQSTKPASSTTSSGNKPNEPSKRSRNLGRIFLVILLVLFGIALYFKMKESV